MLDDLRGPDSLGDELPPPPRRNHRSDADGTLPRKLAGYEVGREIGRGGMSLVLHARDIRLDRTVALKLILSGVYSDQATRERFIAEARVTARLRHPHIVQIYDVGDENGVPFMALELVEGGTLAREVAARPLSARRAAELLETLARAVAYAHTRGVVHRDLKPANVLLGPDGPKVADFGVAVVMDPDTSARSGILAGTPNYMAPEQAEGRRTIGPLADVYALGAILYESLTSRPPFKAATPLETLDLVRSRPPVPPADLQPGVPDDLNTICLKCLEKEPGRRYASAEAVADDLRRFLDGRPIVARPVGRIEMLSRWIRRKPTDAALVASLVLVLAIGFAGVFWQWRRAEGHYQQSESRREQVEQLYIESEAKKKEAQLARAETAASLKELQAAIENNAYLVNTIDLDSLFHFRVLPVRRELLKPALRVNQEFIRLHGDDPEREAEVVAAYFRVAILTRLIGDSKEALEVGLQALQRHQAFSRSHPDVIQYRRNLAACFHNVGFLTNGLDHPEDAIAHLNAARRIREELCDNQPDNLDYQSELAGVLNDLGLVWFTLGERKKEPAMYATAEQLFRSALDRQRKVAHEAPQVLRYRILVGNHTFNLARQLALLGKVAEAVPLVDEILQSQTDDANSTLRAARVLILASVSSRGTPQAESLMVRAVGLVQRAYFELPIPPSSMALTVNELAQLKGRPDFDRIAARVAARDAVNSSGGSGPSGNISTNPIPGAPPPGPRP